MTLLYDNPHNDKARPKGWGFSPSTKRSRKDIDLSEYSYVQSLPFSRRVSSFEHVGHMETSLAIYDGCWNGRDAKYGQLLCEFGTDPQPT